MKTDKALEELQVIRALMERPIRYSTLSGKSAVLAGLAALAGTAANWRVWLATPRDHVTAALLASRAIWIGVLAVAATGAVPLSWQREKRQGLPFWTRIKRRILATILPVFAASLGLTAGIAPVVRASLGGPP
jgi:ABC-type dipeptide/oligopeptide/nickel transport system permease component